MPINITVNLVHTINIIAIVDNKLVKNISPTLGLFK